VRQCLPRGCRQPVDDLAYVQDVEQRRDQVGRLLEALHAVHLLLQRMALHQGLCGSRCQRGEPGELISRWRIRGGERDP
jgi:hypothetical protein